MFNRFLNFEQVISKGCKQLLKIFNFVKKSLDVLRTLKVMTHLLGKGQMFNFFGEKLHF